MQNLTIVLLLVVCLFAGVWVFWPPVAAGAVPLPGEVGSKEAPAAAVEQVGVAVSIRDPAGSADEVAVETRGVPVRLSVVDAVTEASLGAAAQVTGVAGVALQGAGEVRELPARPEGAISVVAVAAQGYWGEEFRVLHVRRDAPVQLRLRRVARWDLTVTDPNGAGIAEVVLELRSSDGGKPLQTPPTDNHGLTYVDVPLGAYLARVQAPEGLVPASARPSLPGGLLDSGQPTTLVLDRLQVAAVRCVGDDVLGGYLQRGFSTGIAIGSYLQEAQRLEAEVRRSWPDAHVAAALPDGSGGSVWFHGFAKNSGWLSRECHYQTMGPEFEPQLVQLEAGGEPRTGTVRVEVFDAAGAVWSAPPFVLQSSSSGGSVNVEIGGGGELEVPLGRVAVQSLQGGVPHWVDVQGAPVRLTEGNRFGIVTIRAKERLTRRRLLLFVERGGVVREFSGTVSLFDGGVPVGPLAVVDGGIELWAPARSLQVRGSVRIGEANVEVRADVPADGEVVLLR